MKKTLIMISVALLVLILALAVYINLKPKAPIAPFDTPAPTTQIPSPTTNSTDNNSQTPQATNQKITLPKSTSSSESDASTGNEVAREQVVLSASDHLYHRENCPTLQDKTNVTFKKDAVLKGYNACPVCKP